MASQATQSAAPVHRFILLTDIVQSSRLAEQYPSQYESALGQHNQLVEQTVSERGGEVYKQTGDGYLVLFETAGACLDAALELGEALGQLEPLAADEPLLVRLALHAGELKPSGPEYFGPALNRVSRICQVCNPGQVLLSVAVKATLPGALDGFELRDLGQHHLRDLAEPEQLFQLDCVRFSLHEFPPLSTLDNRPNNLVEQPNAFIGRERELRELAEMLLNGKRLVSITAPGGYGKSRLAAQLCANLLHRFANGVFMAYLAPVRESPDVPTAIANALGYQFTAGRRPEEQLCDYLRAKELLLCLDNFEHVLDSAPLVAELLQAAPKLKVVITSREPLRLQGEHIYRLEPLPVGVKGREQYSEAQTLFADRAALISSEFALSADNAPQVLKICQQLSGIPLAIELAAAWIDSFALGELSEELSQQLELEARASDRPERHQSLKACLDWSWNLLGQEQQETLMRLSTFRGGFFSDAAAGVLGIKGMKLRATLGRLSDKSWLYTREVDGQARFFLRDMLAHEYAFTRLQETRPSSAAGGPARDELAGTATRPTEDDSLFEQAVSAHARYFVALVQGEGPRLLGGGAPDNGAVQLAALRTWRLELDNIQEALDSGVRRGEADWLLAIARHLRGYLEWASEYYTQRDRYKLMLEATPVGGHVELRMHVLFGLGRAQWRLGKYDAARELYEQALGLSRELGDSRSEANCLKNLGVTERDRDSYSAALSLFEQSLAIFRKLGDRTGEASCLNNLGQLAHRRGNYGEARQLFKRALDLYRELGNRGGEASCVGNLGIIECQQGNYDAGRELLALDLALNRELGNRNGEANCLCNLGNLEGLLGDFRAARSLYEQALGPARELGDRSGEATCLGNLASLESKQGNYDASRPLFEQALALCRELGDRSGEACCLCDLARVESQQGNYSTARSLFAPALALFHELGDELNQAMTCVFAGITLIALGRLRAGALAVYAGQHRALGLEYTFDPDEQHMLDFGQARLDTAVAEKHVTADELEQLKAQAETLSFDELVESTLTELAKAQTLLQERGQATGTADGS